MDRGLVFNIQRYCLHDGPGIRTTVFLQGCPLNCCWCHNPESRSRESSVAVLESRCERCGQCVAACPWDGRRSECTLCGACVAACPTGARQMLGREMTVDQVLEEVLRDRVFFDQSGGGVTLSGGEPLAQPDFLLQLLPALRRRAIHTALDTSGFAPLPVLLGAAPWVDLFLYDLKTVDDAAHQRWTGVSNQRILENLEALGAIHANIWIRIPLVPGFNMDPRQLDAAARHVATIPGVRQVNVLPYHRLGTGKTRGSGCATARAVTGLSGIDPIAPEQIERAAEVFRAAGLTTLIGG